jgi:hypothetical protein
MIILGLQNPYDGEALAPEPINSAGWRLWRMTGLTREEYLRIDRRNLLSDDVPWDDEPGAFFARSLQPGDIVVALGDEVRRALGLRKQLIVPVARDGVTYRQIPHPSGRNLFYNDPVNTKLVERMLRCLTSNGSLKSAEELTATFGSERHSRRT